MISVIIPASNEGSVIGTTLATLLDDARPGEMEVIVVCNGCTDDTTVVVASFAPMVRLIETPVPSKSHALNLGDGAAMGFPRFYVDADIQLHTSDVRRIAEALQSTPALAASPRLKMDVSNSTWPVRAYHRIWVKLPSVEDGLMGRGVYCVSEQGRARFEQFPDVIADDLFMHLVFDADSRISVRSCTSVVRAPRSLGGLLERKTRSFAGNRQLQSRSTTGALAKSDATAWLRVVMAHPKLALDAPVYLFVTLLAKARGRWKIFRGDVGTWNRDDSTRVAAGSASSGTELRPPTRTATGAP